MTKELVIYLIPFFIQFFEGFAYGMFCAAGIVLRRTKIKSAVIFGNALLLIITMMFWFFPWWNKLFAIYLTMHLWTSYPLHFFGVYFVLVASFALGLWWGLSVYRRAYDRSSDRSSGGLATA
jgi:hypothetical protein